MAVDPVTCEPFSNDLQNTGVGSIVSVATVLVAFSAASTVAPLSCIGAGRSVAAAQGNRVAGSLVCGASAETSNLPSEP